MEVSFETIVIKVDDLNSLDVCLQEPAELIQKGELVAFPTETVYGLGANALNSNAVNKIFQAKGRPSDNPLIVHISSFDMLSALVAPGAMENAVIDKLCKRFWPGPLTLLLPKSSQVPERVTAGQEMVAVRWPSHPVAQRLIQLSNRPIAAPSANVSGRPSPTTASHVKEDLNGKIPCIIDGGPTNFGVESTVVDVYHSPPLILRPGGITLEQLREVIPSIEVYEKKAHGTELEQKPATPGLKYRHYSPTAKVVLFEEQDGNRLRELVHKRVVSEFERNAETKIGIIHTHATLTYNFNLHLSKELQANVVMHYLGDVDHPDVVAQGIFAALRELDSQKVDIIMIEGISEKNEGLAVMNRMRKAASEVVK